MRQSRGYMSRVLRLTLPAPDMWRRSAKREKVNRGYMSRVLRLTLLAPDVVEAILDGRQPEGMRLEDLLEGVPVAWEGQRLKLLESRG